MRKKNPVRIITILFLCFVPIWMIICKDRNFSQKENRYLASFPKLSIASIQSGSFMDDFETYLTDQFPLRDACVSLKTTALRIAGERMINGVYIAKDGYLIAKENEYDKSDLKELLTSVNDFAERNSDIDVNFMLVPNASSIYEDKLPYNIQSGEKSTMSYIEKRLSENIDYIDVYDSIEENKSVGSYYKTDHHWTTRGAYQAFKKYASENDLDTSDVDYSFYTVTGDFQGTQASDCGVYSSHDTIEICVPDGAEGNYILNYVENTTKSASFFDESKLAEKDKYLVFMGGNYSEVDVTTSNDTGKNLLIIKDSYANCFVPMLTPYYDKIVIVDPRYFYDNIYEIIDNNKINEVMFLYNVNSFVTDNSLKDVLDNVPKPAEE